MDPMLGTSICQKFSVVLGGHWTVSVVDPDPKPDLIRIQEGKKDPHTLYLIPYVVSIRRGGGGIWRPSSFFIFLI
jgi:hypothetical protein